MNLCRRAALGATTGVLLICAVLGARANSPVTVTGAALLSFLVGLVLCAGLCPPGRTGMIPHTAVPRRALAAGAGTGLVGSALLGVVAVAGPATPSVLAALGLTAAVAGWLLGWGDRWTTEPLVQVLAHADADR